MCGNFKMPPLFHLRNFHEFRKFWMKQKPNFGKYDVVEPGNVSRMRSVPEHIPKPSYYRTGEPREFIDKPEIKNPEALERMRDSCKLSAKILSNLESFLQIGRTTDELDMLVHELIVSHGAYPSPLNYKHFPKSICTSVNNVACHGIPDDRRLEDGDIINVDITVFYNGYHGDCSKTFLIGNVDRAGRELVLATELALNAGIDVCKPGRKFKEIGRTIEEKANSLGYTVVPAFIGHGIGYYFHGPPDIFHIRNEENGEMAPGMTFTIEPVLTQGGPEIGILDDNWTAVTLDLARTAQFEHTVLITETGVEVLTNPD